MPRAYTSPEVDLNAVQLLGSLMLTIDPNDSSTALLHCYYMVGVQTDSDFAAHPEALGNGVQSSFGRALGGVPNTGYAQVGELTMSVTTDTSLLDMYGQALGAIAAAEGLDLTSGDTLYQAGVSLNTLAASGPLSPPIGIGGGSGGGISSGGISAG